MPARRLARPARATVRAAAHPIARALAHLPLLAALAGAPLLAQSTDGVATTAPTVLDTDRVLVVGTRRAPPFAMQDSTGRWVGITHDLWQAAAERVGVRYELRELSLEGLLAGVADGTLDAAVGALTVTPDRERQIDFTHPFHVSGLGIAVRPGGGSGWLAVARRFLSREFVGLVGVLVALLFTAGLLVWLFERRRNTEQFGGPTARGLGTSMWWSAVTMTTVGYGDVAPRTLGGRLVALVWMFSSIVLVSGFTAAITSALTVGALQGPVSGPDDLPGVRVATVGASTSASYLDDRGVAYAAHPTVDAALDALLAGRVDAVVYDAPILRHLARARAGEVVVLPGSFERQYYGIALPPASPLREPLNRALLEILEEPRWSGVLARYLGE